MKAIALAAALAAIPAAAQTTHHDHSSTAPATYARWGNGGDYLGIATEADGKFRLLWADSRSGTYQVYTAPVVVERTADSKPAGMPDVPPGREKADLIDKVALVFDPVSYDPSTGIAVFPVRLKNTTKIPIFGPLTLAVRKPKPGTVAGEAGGDPAGFEIINAVNGVKGPGAVFDASGALGDFNSLGPAAVTEAIPIKVRFANPLITTLSIDLEAAGFLEGPAEVNKK